MKAVEKNAVRQWAVRMARVYKDLFAVALIPRRWLYRWLFGDGEGGLNRVGEHALADLRRFCFAGPMATVFDPDPLVMARREGRREVFARIQYFLNLDEGAVQKLIEMEVDDDDGY